jgi:hypothetical protein
MWIWPASGDRKAGDHAQQRGFAAARGAEDGEEAAALHREGQILHGGLAGVGFTDVLGLQVCVHR